MVKIKVTLSTMDGEVLEQVTVSAEHIHSNHPQYLAQEVVRVMGAERTHVVEEA